MISVLYDFEVLKEKGLKAVWVEAIGREVGVPYPRSCAEGRIMRLILTVSTSNGCDHVDFTPSHAGKRFQDPRMMRPAM
jgi:hypothetical protein